MAKVKMGGGVGDWARRASANIYAQQAAEDERASAPYKAALEKAAYADAGRQYGQGYGQITNFLASAGPLADSGAATALRSKLAGSIYGAAAGRVGNSYADFLARLAEQRRQFNYQQQLMKQQKRPWYQQALGAVGGAAGAFLGG